MKGCKRKNLANCNFSKISSDSVFFRNTWVLFQAMGTKFLVKFVNAQFYKLQIFQKITLSAGFFSTWAFFHRD